jgi:cytochrome c oxidase assembly protein subunit 15
MASSFAPSLRRAAIAAVVANVGIVLTGGVVRLTGSGLGCPDWPRCEGTSVVPPAASEHSSLNQAIEFGNRLLTFVLLAIAIWVVLAARRHAAGRADIQRLAWLQPAGILAQAVLGGITVRTGLNPLVVAAHFLLSMVIIAAAVLLWERVRVQPSVDAVPDHATTVSRLTAAIVVVAGVVLVLGTLVTAAGPHAGDPGTPRLGLDIRTVAVAHADAVWLLLGLTTATAIIAHAARLNHLRRATLILLGVEVAQGGIGYLQYALGIPPEIVTFHLLGASAVWVAAWHTAVTAQRYAALPS